jgi:hypothetical protein
MKLSCNLLPLVLASILAPTLALQNPATPAPKPMPMPMPAAQQAPGAAVNKVWVNTASMVYHCPGDRYYGKTKAGKYMTEPEAKAAGAHGERNTTCFR